MQPVEKNPSVQPVQMTILRSSTYKVEVYWLHFDNDPGVQEKLQVQDQQPRFCFLSS